MRNNIEMPNKIQRIGFSLMVFLTFLIGFMTILGLMVRDAEMAIVLFVITAIFATLVFSLDGNLKHIMKKLPSTFYWEDTLGKIII